MPSPMRNSDCRNDMATQAAVAVHLSPLPTGSQHRCNKSARAKQPRCHLLAIPYGKPRFLQPGKVLPLALPLLSCHPLRGKANSTTREKTQREMPTAHPVIPYRKPSALQQSAAHTRSQRHTNPTTRLCHPTLSPRSPFSPNQAPRPPYQIQLDPAAKPQKRAPSFEDRPLSCQPTRIFEPGHKGTGHRPNSRKSRPAPLLSPTGNRGQCNVTLASAALTGLQPCHPPRGTAIVATCRGGAVPVRRLCPAIPYGESRMLQPELAADLCGTRRASYHPLRAIEDVATPQEVGTGCAQAILAIPYGEPRKLQQLPKQLGCANLGTCHPLQGTEKVATLVLEYLRGEAGEDLPSPTGSRERCNSRSSARSTCLIRDLPSPTRGTEAAANHNAPLLGTAHNELAMSYGEPEPLRQGQHKHLAPQRSPRYPPWGIIAAATAPHDHLL